MSNPDKHYDDMNKVERMIDDYRYSRCFHSTKREAVEDVVRLHFRWLWRVWPKWLKAKPREWDV